MCFFFISLFDGIKSDFFISAWSDNSVLLNIQLDIKHTVISMYLQYMYEYKNAKVCTSESMDCINIQVQQNHDPHRRQNEHTAGEFMHTLGKYVCTYCR